MPDGPGRRDVDPHVIRALVDETRTVREAVHELVLHMRRERFLWERNLSSLSLRTTLTPTQRQCFQHRRPAR
jgi:hypothetical protein